MRYPGLFAPASLKRDRVPEQGRAVDRLSGAFCPGLIEAWLEDVSLNQHVRLSGAFCPGLIEARAPPKEAATTDRLSGAFCPGLIEAPPGAVAIPLPLSVIRGFLPRPH